MPTRRQSEVLADSAQIWSEAGPDAKRRFEQALYPDGVVYDPAEAFRTVPAPLVFRPLELAEGGKSRLVAQARHGSNILVEWCHHIKALRTALEMASFFHSRTSDGEGLTSN